MKRFVAVLGGLLTLPAFAENALIYRDEVILNKDLSTDVDADNVSATAAGRSSRRGNPNAGRSVTRAGTVASNAQAVSNRNAGMGRVVASGRSAAVAPVEAGRRAVTRSDVMGVSRTNVNSRRVASPSVNSADVARVATAVGARVRARAANVSTNVGDAVVSVSNSGDAGAAPKTQTAASATEAMDAIAQMTAFCKTQYTECMDNFCNVLDDNQGRCSCSKNVKNYEKTETALKQATEALQDVAQQIQYIGLSKYEIETLFSQTEAELQMQATTDNSQIKNSLDKIRSMIVDVKPGTASSTSVTDGLSLDLSGLLDFNIGSAGFDLGALFGNSGPNTSSISNQRGEQLYKTAAARCKAAVLNDCAGQGVDISVVSNSYDLEIDKQCVAYERALTDANDEMRQTVRNAKSVLQRARLMVAQQKNAYDLRGCINALDSCMQDDFVCGNDYENCLDPSGKYVVNGEIVVGSAPGQAVSGGNLQPGQVYSVDGLYATWNYNNNKNAWGADDKYQEGSLNEYIDKTVLKTEPKEAGETMSQYFQYKIGYIADSKSYGMCANVLNKCQDYTFENGKYKPDNRVVKEYLARTLVRVKKAQDELLADYAEACISDVTSCLGENGYVGNTSNGNKDNIAINACRSQIITCMSVNGDATSDPTPSGMSAWVKSVMQETPPSSSASSSWNATTCRGYARYWDAAQSKCICYSGHAWDSSGQKCYVKGLSVTSSSVCSSISGATWDGAGCYCPTGAYTGYSSVKHGVCISNSYWGS